METRNEIVDEESIPHECFCPITQEIMEDPVIAQDGHTYERSAIKEWFDRGNRNSPKTGARLLSTELIPNYAMRSLIQDLKANPPALQAQKLQMQKQTELIEKMQQHIGQLETATQSPKDCSSETLQEAAKKGNLEVVCLWLAHDGASVDDRCRFNGYTALYNAASNGHLEIVRLLLANGASINKKTKSGISALYSAAFDGHLEVVRLLLTNGASVDDRCRFTGDTALYSAASNGHLEVVRLLLAKGASVSGALAGAASGGDLEVVRLLLANGASIFGALHGASSHGHIEVARLLLANGARDSINEKCDDSTALHDASYNSHLEVVRLLLANGASVNEKMTPSASGCGSECDLWTPLHCAASEGNIEIIRLLLANGASISEKDDHGKTPLDVASKSEAKEFLRSYRPTQLSTNPSRFIGNQNPKPPPQQDQNQNTGLSRNI